MYKQKLINPKTSSGVKQDYANAKFYEDYVLQKEYYSYQFDGWKDKKFYGLIDKDGRSIYPKRSFLAPTISDVTSNSRNFNFVVDAFQDLKKYHMGLQDTNKLEKNSSIYYNLPVRKGAINIDDIYIDYINNFFSIFSNSTKTTTSKKIKNFSSFIDYLINFLKIVTKIAPFTRSNFIKSKLCNVNVNGLNIDFSNTLNYSNLILKADNFLSDTNFDVFYDSAKRFGFYVDRNIPWRIVADIESPIMKEYYRKYGINNSDQLIGNYYHLAEYSDLEVMKNVIVSLWNTYASENPTNTELKEQKNCSSLFVEISSLNQIDVETFDKYYNISWLLRLYIFLRIKEERIKLTQSQFEIMHSESFKLYTYVDEKNAIDYISRKLKEYLLLQGIRTEQLTTQDSFVKMLSTNLSLMPSEGITF